MKATISKWSNDESDYYNATINVDGFVDLVRYLFEGEYNISNCFDGKLFNWFKSQDKDIVCVYNGAVVLDKRYIQINALNGDDNVVCRVRFFI